MVPFAGVAHLVERDLAKVEVASSSLVARSKKKNHPLGGFSFWNAAGRMELAASTCAQRVKSRGEGRAPANGSAIRGMPVASRASLRFLLLRYARRTNNKTCGQSQKETPSVRMVFLFGAAILLRKIGRLRAGD